MTISRLALIAALSLGLAFPAGAQAPQTAAPDTPAASQPQGHPPGTDAAADAGERSGAAPEREARQGRPGGGQGTDRRQAERPSPDRRLPPDSVTRHRLDLPGRSLAFTATAGALPLVDGNGALQAEIGFVSYTLDGKDPSKRPVTFVMNGGPGASSAYLHLGVLGPWRLPLDGATISPSAPPDLVPNPETWLDFTDIVFIDPPGTGYSRIAGGDQARERFYSVDGDIDTLAAVITRWLKVNDRLVSPKFFVGESYGGFRGPLLAEKLHQEQGIGLSGLTLLSPVLDFAWLGHSDEAPWVLASRLPSLAAAAREKAGMEASREALQPAEQYASGEYISDLMRGLADREAVARASERVAALTGLDPVLVRRLAGRVGMGTFQREIGRGENRNASAYDTGVTNPNPQPTAPNAGFHDPVLDAMTAPLTSAMLDHLARNLNWRVENQRYELLSGSVNGAWRWGRGRTPPESMNELRRSLALDETMRVLVVHGFTDLVTPYFASELLLRQLPDATRGRTALKVYPGGHMFYSRDASRTAFRNDAEAMYREALAAREKGAGRAAEAAPVQ